jgi:putative MATE family efflux protein
VGKRTLGRAPKQLTRAGDPRSLNRQLILLAIPALGTILAEPLYTLVDTAIVGHLGAGKLEALAVSGTALSLTGWLAAFLTTATTSTVAHRAASGDDTGASRSAGAAYLTAVALGAVSIVGVWLVAPTLATLIGGSGQTLSESITYLRLSSFGLPFLFVAFAGTGHLVGQKNTVSPLRIVIAANVLNVVLELILVFGAGLGLRGSAIGTVVAQFLAAIAFLLSSWRRSISGPPRWPVRMELNRLLRDGATLSIRTLAVGGALVLATATASRLGALQLAGHQIALRVWLFLGLTLDALAVPAQVFVSGAMGRRDPGGAVEVGRRVLRLGLIAGVVLGIVDLVAAWLAPALFTTQPTVRHAAWVALVIGALLLPLAAGAFVFDGLILGLADYSTLRSSMLIAFAAFVPVAVLVDTFHRFGLVTLWIGLGIWLVSRTLLLRRRWIRLVKTHR